MTDQAIEELLCLVAKSFGFACQLCNGVIKAVRHLHVFAEQIFHQLHIMVARNANRVSALHHRHNEPQHFNILWTAVAKVAEEGGFPPTGMRKHAVSAFFVA